MTENKSPVPKLAADINVTLGREAVTVRQLGEEWEVTIERIGTGTLPGWKASALLRGILHGARKGKQNG